jgi:hypothetical protein
MCSYGANAMLFGEWHLTGTGITQGAREYDQGMLMVASDGQIAVDEDVSEQELSKSKEEEQSTLSGIIDACWQDNERYKEESNIDEDMIKNLQQREGIYSSDKLDAIAEMGGTAVFMGLTNVKCRAAESWISDVFMSGLEKSWSFEPSPIPDLPVDVEKAIAETAMIEWQMKLQNQAQQMTPADVFKFAAGLRADVEENLEAEASVRSKRMEKKIEDQFCEGNFEEAFDDFLTDIVTLKAGILKGPILHRKRVLKWVQGPDGKMAAQITEEIRPEWKRVSPFDCFPSRGAVSCNDGEFIEKQKFTRKSLLECKGLPNYDDKEIDAVLTEYGRGGLREWTSIDQDRAQLEKKGTDLSENRNLIDGMEFWGSVQGQHLLDRGMSKDPRGNAVDPLGEYEINAIKIGRHIIYANFLADPLGRRPYYKTGYAKIPGSFWYKGVPDLMNDLQDICNAAVRALVNNMGIASGPQVVIEDINRIPAGESITQLYAWKIWQLVNKSNSTLPGINFHDVKSNAPELMGVYEKFAMLADDYTGIPAYSYGNDKTAGAGRTMGGLTILMNSASRGIKKVIYRIDKDVMKPALQNIYDYNMMYDPDESIKGDVEIKALGALELIVKEQIAARRMEFLNTTNNPVDLSIMGPERRANVLRAAAKVLYMQVDDVVPTKEEMEEKVQQMEMMQQQQQAQAQAGAVQVQ